MNLDELALQLHPHYSDFQVAERLLFTGHSHQAWPNVAKQGLLECYHDAAELVDEKWGKAFERVNVLRNYLRNWYKDPSGKYTPASSTHDLLIKWLSALHLKEGDEIVTTGGEFYSVFRQLKALEEIGVHIRWVDTTEYQTIDERLYAAIHPDTKAVIVSRVFFESGLKLQNLLSLAEKCASFGIPMLIDDYHGTNVLPETIGGTA
jgi:selenocysteine lyase/cysteine desulfurase